MLLLISGGLALVSGTDGRMTSLASLAGHSAVASIK
jgi:hypothetical protein